MSAPKLPSEGGSYTRNAKGSLRRTQAPTKPPASPKPDRKEAGK